MHAEVQNSLILWRKKDCQIFNISSWYWKIMNFFYSCMKIAFFYFELRIKDMKNQSTHQTRKTNNWLTFQQVLNYFLTSIKHKYLSIMVKTEWYLKNIQVPFNCDLILKRWPSTEVWAIRTPKAMWLSYLSAGMRRYIWQEACHVPLVCVRTGNLYIGPVLNALTVRVCLKMYTVCA